MEPHLTTVTHLSVINVSITKTHLKDLPGNLRCVTQVVVVVVTTALAGNILREEFKSCYKRMEILSL